MTVRPGQEGRKGLGEEGAYAQLGSRRGMVSSSSYGKVVGAGTQLGVRTEEHDHDVQGRG